MELTDLLFLLHKFTEDSDPYLFFKVSSLLPFLDFTFLFLINLKDRGTQRPNVSIYARGVSNGFLLALETSLIYRVALKTVYLFGCLRGTLDVTKVFNRWLFRLIRKC